MILQSQEVWGIEVSRNIDERTGIKGTGQKLALKVSITMPPC